MLFTNSSNVEDLMWPDVFFILSCLFTVYHCTLDIASTEARKLYKPLNTKVSYFTLSSVYTGLNVPFSIYRYAQSITVAPTCTAHLAMFISLYSISPPFYNFGHHFEPWRTLVNLSIVNAKFPGGQTLDAALWFQRIFQFNNKTPILMFSFGVIISGSDYKCTLTICTALYLQ